MNTIGKLFIVNQVFDGEHLVLCLFTISVAIKIQYHSSFVTRNFDVYGALN